MSISCHSHTPIPAGIALSQLVTLPCHSHSPIPALGLLLLHTVTLQCHCHSPIPAGIALVTYCHSSMSLSLPNPSWDCSCYILSLSNVTVTTQSQLGLLCHLNVTLPSLRVTLQLLQLSQNSLVNHSHPPHFGVHPKDLFITSHPLNQFTSDLWHSKGC